MKSVFLVFTLVLGTLGQLPPAEKSKKVVRFCLTTDEELSKCTAMKAAVEKQSWAASYGVECVKVADIFMCMQLVQNEELDVMTVDAGELVLAGRRFRLIPLVGEVYGSRPDYFSVAVVKATEDIVTGSYSNVERLERLQGKKVCSPGMGTAAGWVIPVSHLIEEKFIEVKRCNVHLQQVASHFGSMCVPNAMIQFYNPYGINPTKACELCDKSDCSASNKYAGFHGAFQCLANGGGQVAFLKESTVTTMLGNTTNGRAQSPDDFRLLCPDGSISPVKNYRQCSWGTVKGNAVVGHGSAEHITKLKEFFTLLSRSFAPAPASPADFHLFGSEKYGGSDVMFSDDATSLVDVGSRDTYHKYVGSEYIDKLKRLDACPINYVRWCTTSQDEINKCAEMMLALQSKSLKPTMKCIMGKSARDCMQKISDGDADVIVLDAADTYVAGKYFGLVPIAAEDYGDDQMSYFAVAVARKSNPGLTIFNLKSRRACFSGVNMAAGWVIPVFSLIETNQIKPQKCGLYQSMSEFFFKACAPGMLEKYYNPDQVGLNLCEACAAGGADKCQRTSREQYYGDSGAFRCLVEGGGEIAFTRSLSIRDNTDGRNEDEWARNRRSDDYELLCKNGHRMDIDSWKQCNLAEIRAPAVVTAGYKSERDREIIWELLDYAQNYFSMDGSSKFTLFDSGFNKHDLMFSDSAVKLLKIPKDQQDYKKWLKPYFLGLMKRLQEFQCDHTASSATSLYPSVMLYSLISVLVTFVFSHIL